jgi:hypothetical protein
VRAEATKGEAAKGALPVIPGFATDPVKVLSVMTWLYLREKRDQVDDERHAPGCCQAVDVAASAVSVMQVKP